MARFTQLGLAIAGAISAIAALAIASLSNDTVVLFNHSPSVPTGFYVRTTARIDPGAFVTVRAVDVAPLEAHRRRYDHNADRFIKRVTAVGGQTVCGDGRRVMIDGRVAASVYAGGDRVTPNGWVGCRTLRADEVLLLGDSADSFDGRYWGPISNRLIEGVWRPL